MAALHVAALAPQRVAGLPLVAPHDGARLFPQPPAYGLRSCSRRAGIRRPAHAAPASGREPRAISPVARDAFVAHRIIDDHHRLSGQTRALIRAWRRLMAQ